ncbi:MAG: hypothetical protein FWF76_06565 [Oscillospiraceae bacterium]|nr:hypothetical protein [Oscillospiraceae bacterium]
MKRIILALLLAIIIITLTVTTSAISFAPWGGSTFSHFMGWDSTYECSWSGNIRETRPIKHYQVRANGRLVYGFDNENANFSFNSVEDVRELLGNRGTTFINELKTPTIQIAIDILRYLVDLPNEATIPTHNFNQNGELDIDDAIQVLRYLVNLPSALD